MGPQADVTQQPTLRLYRPHLAGHLHALQPRQEGHGGKHAWPLSSLSGILLVNDAFNVACGVLGWVSDLQLILGEHLERHVPATALVRHQHHL